MPQRVCLLFHASSANLSVSRAQREVQRHLFWRKADGRRQFQSHPTQRKRRMGPNLAGVFYATAPFQERFFRVSRLHSVLKHFTPGISNSVMDIHCIFFCFPPLGSIFCSAAGRLPKGYAQLPSEMQLFRRCHPPGRLLLGMRLQTVRLLACRNAVEKTRVAVLMARIKFGHAK